MRCERCPAAQPRSWDIYRGERFWFLTGKCTSTGWATRWKAALWGWTLGSYWALAEEKPGMLLTAEATSSLSCTRQSAASRAGEGSTKGDALLCPFQPRLSWQGVDLLG